MSLHTKRLYYADTYQTEADASIIAADGDDKGSYVVFDQTIFHPQGGGQPSDKGFFTVDGKKCEVTKLAIDGEAIRHYINGDHHDLIGKKVHQQINDEERILYARYHTAGHLFANIVNQFHPDLDGSRGNHFPSGQAFVVISKANKEDKEAITPFNEEQKAIILAEFKKIVAQDVKVNIIYDQQGNRSIQIEGYKAFPCGGTHLNSTAAIGQFVIRSSKKEKGSQKIGYDLKGDQL